MQLLAELKALVISLEAQCLLLHGIYKKAQGRDVINALNKLSQLNINMLIVTERQIKIIEDTNFNNWS